MAPTGMHIDVTGRNLEVTVALREYAEKKVRKLFRFFRGGDADAEVVLTVERDRHTAEVTLYVDGVVLRAESRTYDMYASIDEATDRIEQQVRKYKTRIQRRLQATPRKPAEVGVTMVDVGNGDGESAAPIVVRTKRFAVKPMDVDEAITQMELVGHDFFVFTNSSTEQINVVYRRRDGNYGLIEPEY